MHHRTARTAPVAAALLLAGCVAPREAGPAPAATPAAPTYSSAGLETVLGQSARALVAAFGQPDLDVREGNARKLQFLSPACVLDAYLYPPSRGGEPVVAHLDARLPDGRDIDRSSCVAAMSRRREAR